MRARTELVIPYPITIRFLTNVMVLNLFLTDLFVSPITMSTLLEISSTTLTGGDNNCASLSTASCCKATFTALFPMLNHPCLTIYLLHQK